ncbi:MAG: deoxyribodipyrimidine photo-lyase [Planktotalea sp.]|uniref:cryptochrome/photolyase family protein n=1 Tax=Planktotalea sp. TaxID=2029877 RepID=UPI002638E091|nr:deoxyribodipyrimidine photo-lyase [Planktotalea sp.]MDG1084247.1 deoxyribodipyrimidine photo-lyase [Planktotalea sp.]
MTKEKPIIVWFRRDLRVSDHPALSAACSACVPVIAVFIKDDIVDGLGAAPKWRLGKALEVFTQTLARLNIPLILREGPAGDVLDALITETDAQGVYWSRLYDPACVTRDTVIKADLLSKGLEARSFGGHLMFEPWMVETKTGGMYKVYTPFWRSVKDRDVDVPLAVPTSVQPYEGHLESADQSDWALGAAMRRGGVIVARHAQVGEAAAQARLADFIENDVSDYVERRDIPSTRGTSGLSENLALGEISPHQCWHAGMRALHEGKDDSEVFLKELVWREFAYHLTHHTPHILDSNWKSDWDKFAWNEDADHPEVIAWKQGRTGIEFVDAAMREMYVTGKMHNRGRMIVASYLTKHLLTHWKVGQAWFDDCLTDWDPASNAMGWQWAAGSGPDASPYFRVFNPVTQLDKFDRERGYARAWIAEGQGNPPDTATSYFEAIPKSWGLRSTDIYPKPIVEAATGRQRALNAYQGRGF